MSTSHLGRLAGPAAIATSFRSGVYPKVTSASIVIGGVLGFQALLSPWGVPLALAVGAAGVWLIRQRSAVDSEATTTRAAHYVG